MHITYFRIMPRGAAFEILCFERRMTASEAKMRGLVTDVFPTSNFYQQGQNFFYTQVVSLLTGWLI